MTMFTQLCFIRKNSKELQDKVYRLGGRSGTCIWDSEFNTLLVADKDHFRCYDDECGNADLLISKGYIDCGTNEKLFLAICAIKNYTDKYQFFVNKDGDFFKCFENEFSHFKFDDKDIGKIVNAMETDSFPCSGEPLVPYEDTKDWHKATVEELIEHFKKD